MGVNKGDVLVIPAPNGQNKNDKNKLTIEWSQMLRQNRGDYYVLIAKNKSQGYAEVAFFIQSEWYNEQGFNSAYNMRRIDDDNYELIMDDRHQYAGEGDSRFVVWHDKNRKPYAVIPHSEARPSGILKAYQPVWLESFRPNGVPTTRWRDICPPGPFEMGSKLLGNGAADFLSLCGDIYWAFTKNAVNGLWVPSCVPAGRSENVVKGRWRRDRDLPM